jgi:hypothetical protein
MMSKVKVNELTFLPVIAGMFLGASGVLMLDRDLRIPVLLVILVFLLTGCTTLQSTPQQTKPLLTTDQVLDLAITDITIGNYKGIAQWVHGHLRYRTDRTKADEWKEVEQTLRDGYGDCEDLAQVHLALLIRMNVKDCFILGVTKKSRNFGHVVCFFRTGDYEPWLFYSNDDAILYKGGLTLQELINSVGDIIRYGSNLDYQLANNKLENIPKEDEAFYGLL